MRLSTQARLAGTGLLLLSLHCAVAQESPEAGGDGPEALQDSYESALDEARREQEMAMAAVERARAQTERAAKDAERAESDQETAREQRRLERQEIEAMRRELSRAHEELRRASREVVRVHRQLGLGKEEGPPHAPQPPVGPRRAIIGVVLGDSDERGVEVLGVSPDGPAERAGMQQGDVIVKVGDVPLAADGEHSAGRALLEAMEEVEPGEELVVTVQRDGAERELKVTAQAREPVSWTSLIRLPSAPDAPNAPVTVEERIELPHIDQAALAEKMAELQEQLSKRRIVIAHQGERLQDLAPQVWEFEFENLSELGEKAMHNANVWFGMPMARGLKLAEVNRELGEYFKADYGVLVLSAEEGNELQLRPGDVLLTVGGHRVERPVDVMRELRGLEPGATLQVEIMRKRKARTLDLVVPESGSGFGFAPEVEHEYHFSVEQSAE